MVFGLIVFKMFKAIQLGEFWDNSGIIFLLKLLVSSPKNQGKVYWDVIFSGWNLFKCLKSLSPPDDGPGQLLSALDLRGSFG